MLRPSASRVLPLLAQTSGAAVASLRFRPLRARQCSACASDASQSSSKASEASQKRPHPRPPKSKLPTSLPQMSALPGQSDAPTPPLPLQNILPSQHPTLRMRAYNRQWAATTDQKVLTWSSLGQKPKVLWLGCSDSRIPESVLCGTVPGQVFVHRNIANTFQQTDRSAMAVLTYAVTALGVEHVVVVGHTSCGGIAAGLNLARQGATSTAPPTKPNKQPETGQEMLLDYLQPLQRLAAQQLHKGKDVFSGGLDVSPAVEKLRLRELVRLHALQQADNIKATDVVRNHKGRLTVEAWVYDVATGLLSDASEPDF